MTAVAGLSPTAGSASAVLRESGSFIGASAGCVVVSTAAPEPGALRIAERMEWGHADPADPPASEYDSCYFCDRERRHAEHAAGCLMAALLVALRAPDPLVGGVVEAAIAYSNPTWSWTERTARRKVLDATVGALLAWREGRGG